MPYRESHQILCTEDENFSRQQKEKKLSATNNNGIKQERQRNNTEVSS